MNKCSLLNIGTLLLLWSIALISQPGYAGLSIDTKGYVSGRLSAVNLERSFNTAYLGELLLGHDSTIFISSENQPPYPFSNPWQFCFDEDRYEEIETFIGRNVVLEYKTPKSNVLLSCSAINELLAIYPVVENRALEQKQLKVSILSSAPEVSRGVEFGKITNVIENRGLIRSYFMTIQIGSGGNQFRHFVMNDSDLFDFAIDCLKTATMVRVYYSERYSINNRFGLNPISYVSKIEVVDQNQFD